MAVSIEYLKIEDLKPYENNPRINDGAVEAVARSIEEFGFKVPIVIDRNNVIVTGHTRLKASKRLGIEEVPCVRVEGMDDQEKRAYILADNLLTERGGWDMDILNSELDEIAIDMSDFGFENVEESLGDMSFPEDEPYLVTCPKCGYTFDPEGGDFDE